MSTPSKTTVLLLGGHGKIALHLTPLLLAKSWNVTSVVRNPDHEPEILALQSSHPGKLSVLVSSLDDITTPVLASKVLETTKPEIIVWAAGAGGKGGPSRTKAIDEVAAKNYISAAYQRPELKKFLMVSYIASRKGTPKWWTKEDIEAAEHVNTKVLPAYAAAKIEADEHFAAVAEGRQDVQAINLRPGTLKDTSAGRVLLGKTPARGDVSRESVARVAAALLERSDTRGWYDLLDGEEEVEEAVERCVKEGWDGIEGEDLERIHGRDTKL